MEQKLLEWLATDLVIVVVVAAAVVVTECREKKVTKRELEFVPKMEVWVAGGSRRQGTARACEGRGR